MSSIALRLKTPTSPWLPESGARILRLAWLETKFYKREGSGLLWSGGLPVFVLLLFTQAFGGPQFGQFIVPGVIAMSLASLSFFAMGTVLSSYRQNGVLRRMRMTPLTTTEFVVAHMLNRYSIGIVHAIGLLIVAYIAFGLTPRGSLGALALVLTVGLTGLLAVGFAIASLAPSPRSAAGIANACFLPSLFLGGAYFPTETLPAAAALVGEFLPVGAFVRSFREVYSGGAPIGAVSAHTTALALWAVAATGLGVARFKWE